MFHALDKIPSGGFFAHPGRHDQGPRFPLFRTQHLAGLLGGDFRVPRLTGRGTIRSALVFEGILGKKTSN